MRDRRGVIFAIVAGVCVIAAVVAVLGAVRQTSTVAKADRKASLTAGARLQRMVADREPVLVFRTLDRKHPKSYGHLAFAPAANLKARVVSGLRCDRIGFNAGRGTCLAASSGVGATTQITVFDSALRTIKKLKVAGIPSRTRVSPTGHFAGLTTFVGGHSYGTPGQFSTATQILDLRSNTLMDNLERWKVTNDGREVRSPDRNFWGLTFSRDDDTFYATMATGGKTHLVRGSIRAHAMTVIHDNVECPSLSPDETRIAYKKKVGGPPAVWRFYVLDLQTMRETPLTETRTIDDQIAWRDDRTVLYGVDETTWSMPADGTGAPHQLLAGANSPQLHVLGRADAQ